MLTSKGQFLSKPIDLFQRVIIAFESGRTIDLDKLLQQELSPVPLSLATLDGNLRLPTIKSNLAKLLEQGLAQSTAPITSNSACCILDGMAIVQATGSANTAKTFGEWFNVFYHFVVEHFSESCTRVDILFDRYL